MIEWFETYKDVISGVSAIGAGIGLLGTMVGLFLSARQMKVQTHLSRAHAIYAIQKDARAEMSTLLPDAVGEALGLPKRPPEQVAIGQIFNFYAAAFQMKQHNVLAETLWGPLEQELKYFANLASVTDYWQEGKWNLDPRYKALVDNLINKQAPGLSGDNHSEEGTRK